MRPRTGGALFLSAVLFGILYAGADMAFGPSGLQAQGVLKVRRDAQRAEIARLTSARDRLAERTRRLIGHDFDPETRRRSPSPVDLDLLEIELRRAFGLGRADEVVLVIDD